MFFFCSFLYWTLPTICVSLKTKKLKTHYKLQIKVLFKGSYTEPVWICHVLFAVFIGQLERKLTKVGTTAIIWCG